MQWATWRWVCLHKAYRLGGKTDSNEATTRHLTAGGEGGCSEEEDQEALRGQQGEALGSPWLNSGMNTEFSVDWTWGLCPVCLIHWSVSYCPFPSNRQGHSSPQEYLLKEPSPVFASDEEGCHIWEPREW